MAIVGIDNVAEANGSEANKGVVQAVNIGPVTFYKVENNRWQHYENANSRQDNQ